MALFPFVPTVFSSERTRELAQKLETERLTAEFRSAEWTPREYYPNYTRPTDFDPLDEAWLSAIGITASDGA